MLQPTVSAARDFAALLTPGLNGTVSARRIFRKRIVFKVRQRSCYASVIHQQTLESEKLCEANSGSVWNSCGKGKPSGRVTNDENRRALWCGCCRNQAAHLLLLLLSYGTPLPLVFFVLLSHSWVGGFVGMAALVVFSSLHVYLVYPRFTWRGYSVAEFSNREDMTRAVRELDDTFFADRRIRVDYVSLGMFEAHPSKTIDAFWLAR